VHLSDYILQQSVFFRREALDDVGYVDEKLHYGMDWDLFIKIGLKYRLAYVREFFGCIREHAEAKSSCGGTQRVRELHSLLRRHTGLALPPGSIVYGLDTYSALACQAIRCHTPRLAKPVGTAIERTVRFVLGNVIGRTIYHSQGLYGDGWAGKTLRYMVRSGCRSVAIEGSVPEHMAQLRGQSLRVECNGRQLGKYAVRSGQFRIEFEVPADLAGQPLHLRIVARRSCVTSPFPWKIERRRIAFQLGSICGA